MTNQKTNENKRRLSALAKLRGYLCLFLALALMPAPLALAADDELPPLIQAAANGDGDEVKRLLRSGADANATDEDGWTSLDMAVQYDYPAIIDILTNNGADVNRQDDDGWTALHFASFLGRPAAARALIKNGANVNLGNADDATPLHITALHDFWIVAEVLINNSADVSRADKHGDTPLHNAAWEGSFDTAELLIEAGADIGKENKAGRKPLYIAQDQGHNEIADALIDADNFGEVIAEKPGRKSVSERVFDKAWRSIVAITSGESFGSGVIIEPGIVATNCHVIGNEDDIIVNVAQDRRIDERVEYPAAVVDGNSDRDLCLLEVEELEAPDNPIKIRTYDSLSIGEDVYAIGNPAGRDLSLSAGIISQLRDDWKRHIQTDAAISGGSSGGGLFDKDGNLVGITTESDVDVVNDNQLLNFAIPADWILGYFTE